jgi:hypothetical protein
MTKLNVVENPTKEVHGFEITRMYLLNMQVCSKLSASEVEKAVNAASPSGTTNGWRVERRGHLKPVECANGDGCKHYILTC